MHSIKSLSKSVLESVFKSDKRIIQIIMKCLFDYLISIYVTEIKPEHFNSR